MANPVEVWKAAKHGFDVWPDVLRYAAEKTPMSQIEEADLERMKWHGFYYRKRDDGGRYMNRIRITANELSSEQAREIALMAYEYGHGIVDVTTRANLQVQGLPIEHLPAVTARLERVGLSPKQTGHDNVRNVFCHPFSGVDPAEILDCRDVCRAIDAVYLGDRGLSNLPRKFNIAVNGTEHHPAHYWTQDLSLLATRDADGEPAFHLLVAGTQGQSTHLAWWIPVLVKPSQAADVARALLELFCAKGSREKRGAARFRYLVEQIGAAGVLEWLETRLPYRLLPSLQEPIPASAPEEFVGWFRQNDPKLWSMGLNIPLGRLSWRQLEGLALLAKRWGNGQLRTTPLQGLAILNIPTGFKDAAATDAAALGLSVQADPIALNTVACTGLQFCNIAVTETKGHMFQLMERLRRKGVMLHGVRIHMSGCPSSCAQHYTADIGLKGVRVRRLLGTREGFDVFLGGGISGHVHLGLPYRLGVDVDQLPNLIEDVLQEYYLKRRSGQTFSAYWRERLQAVQADKVADGDYSPPVWMCEKCQHRHPGEDPPVFCPSCAGLRRYFVRLETADGLAPAATGTARANNPPAAMASGPRPGPASSASSGPSPAPSGPALAGSALASASGDGFSPAMELADLPDRTGREVVLGDLTLAVFREGDRITAIDNACPHEGAPLAEGEIQDGVVSCPWHAWTFNTCSGCSLDPQGHRVQAYETRVEHGRIWVRAGAGQQASARTAAPSAVAVSEAPTALGAAAVRNHPVPASTPPTAVPRPASMAAPPVRAVEAERTVLEILDEGPDVKTFRLDNSDGKIPFDFPGKFLRVHRDCDGRSEWRSFTICSSPTSPERLDLTIKLNPHGEVTRRMFEGLRPGGVLRVKGAQGGYYFDPAKHPEPLVLVSAGSGITPMMSIVRYVQARGLARDCTFLYGARTLADVLFDEECRLLESQTPWFRRRVTLTQPPADWSGDVGRISPEWVLGNAPDWRQSRFFLCGPNDFLTSLQTGLKAAGAPADRIHVEQFHTPRTAATSHA